MIIEGADWSGNRANEKFSYVRVSYPGMTEIGEYGNIVSGNVSKSSFSSIKETCEFTFYGGDAPNVVDAVRIYYSFTDKNGVQVKQIIGTYIVSYTDITYDYVDGATVATGTVNGSSVLSVLADVIIGYPMTIGENVDYVDLARNMIVARDLGVSVTRKSNVYRSSKPYTFDASDSLLTVINYLLNAADYAAARVDEYGNVVLKPYTVARGDAATVELSDGDDSIIGMSVTENNDYQLSPNVVKLVYESENECLYAEASNVSGSRNSLSAMGNREITLFDTISEFPYSISEEAENTPGALRQARIDYLKGKADTRVRDNSSETVHVEWENAFIPLSDADYVSLSYGDREFFVNTTNMDISLKVSTPCKTSGRHISTHEIVTSVNGKIVWAS